MKNYFSQLIFAYIFLSLTTCVHAQDPTSLDKAIQSAHSIVHIEALNIERAPVGRQSAAINPQTGQIMIMRSIPVAQQTKKGAGVIISSSGLVVTNVHTIFGAEKIAVHLPDGSTLSAKVLHLAQQDDLALLKIDPPSPLTPIEFADSDSVRLHDEVINIGSSELLKETISGGIVNGLGTNRVTKEVELIKVNITLYHGDSGGPLLNKNGQLIGMVVGKMKSKDQASFVLPSNKIKKLYLDYIK